MIGDRIKQARLAIGATLEEIASAMTDAGTPITKAGLSKYEKNKSIPSQTFLMSLARHLKVKPSFFITEPEYEIRWHAFRKQTKMPKRFQGHVKASAQCKVEAQLWLTSILHPDEKPCFPEPIAVRNFEQVEKAAVSLRDVWKLQDRTIGCLVELAESNGVIVVEHTGIERDREFDGLSGIVNDHFPVAVISTSGSDDRIRYTLAHELGHLAMNCSGIDEKEEEGLAHRFASAFIVPEQVMRKELGDKRRNVALREFAVLKQKHGLSMQSLVRRARDLDIISHAHYTSLFRQFSSLGWRKKEPVDFKSGEKPTRLLQMVLRALAEGIVSEQRAEHLLPGSVSQGQLSSQHFNAYELRRMTLEQRATVLEAAASEAAVDYIADAELTDFEAFSEDDLYA
ncbi:MAG: ImmA/IrrE family metallo-endopeptidase [Planctomycetaceae bacterium]|nr:ImmA/IrrE family metallo-endopeptidase [Planctomycetales bacterium]MCB9920889.1 ImmA/IrrE family metallo-endopeptidase [Planctomycetaceae bacterium]